MWCTGAVLMVLVSLTTGMDPRTVTEYLSQNDQYSTLVSLLRNANLLGVLGAPGAVYTVFAPTNAAFNKLDPGLLSYLQNNPQIMQRVLLGHVLDSAFISLFIYNERTENTLDGDVLRFNIYNDSTQGQIYTAQGCVISGGDIVVKNGVIHTVDEVILPAEGDILRQILVDDIEFEDLTSAMAVTNLLDELEYEHITLFAPTNAAFIKQFPSTGSIPSNSDVVKGLLQNHVVNGTYFLAGLQNGDTLTALSGKTLTITRSGTQVRVDGFLIDGQIFATNGVIQVLNDVLV